MTATLKQLSFTLLLAGLLSGCGKLNAPVPGVYRAELKLRGGAVPFELQVSEKQGKVVLAMARSDELLPLTGVALQDGRIDAQLPDAAGTLHASIGRGELKGEVRITDPQGQTQILPFTAELDKPYRFVETPSTDNADVSGYWQLEVMDHQYFAKPVTLQLMQSFDAVDGRLQLPDGRPIAVLGQVNGDEVYLSTFGQGRAMFFKGRVNHEGALQGETWVNLSAASRWVARRMPDEAAAALTAGEEPLRKVALPWEIPREIRAQ